MLSLRQFKNSLYQISKYAINLNQSIEVVVNKKVYEVYFKPIDKKPMLKRGAYKTSRKPVQIESENCSVCGNVRLNNICMNRKCPTISSRA